MWKRKHGHYKTFTKTSIGSNKCWDVGSSPHIASFKNNKQQDHWR